MFHIFKKSKYKKALENGDISTIVEVARKGDLYTSLLAEYAYSGNMKVSAICFAGLLKLNNPNLVAKKILTLKDDKRGKHGCIAFAFKCMNQWNAPFSKILPETVRSTAHDIEKLLIRANKEIDRKCTIYWQQGGLRHSCGVHCNQADFFYSIVIYLQTLEK